MHRWGVINMFFDGVNVLYREIDDVVVDELIEAADEFERRTGMVVALKYNIFRKNRYVHISIVPRMYVSNMDLQERLMQNVMWYTMENDGGIVFDTYSTFVGGLSDTPGVIVELRKEQVIGYVSSLIDMFRTRKEEYRMVLDKIVNSGLFNDDVLSVMHTMVNDDIRGVIITEERLFGSFIHDAVEIMKREAENGINIGMQFHEEKLIDMVLVDIVIAPIRPWKGCKDMLITVKELDDVTTGGIDWFGMCIETE